MKRLSWLAGALIVVPLSSVSWTIGPSAPWNSLESSVAQAQSTCGLSQAAFCDTFDAPAGIGNRSGQLNGTVWGVSRETGNNNAGQNMIDAWSPAQLQGCSGTSTVQPPNDIIICNGQLREAVNDNGTVTTLAMYPKQPFDFGGRTGIVAFDVSNDSQGTHAAWPEFWMSDQPVPAPFTHFATWVTAPRNGFGIRLGGAAAAGQGANLAPGCPTDARPRWSVDSAVVVRNYVADDEDNGGGVRVTPLGCVIASSGPGNMNHVELHISTSQIDVYATDAGTTAPLHYIAAIKNANLTLNRGLIWIEDVHYNAGKFNTQREHTFSWDNVGFDGPVLPRDLAFDVLDPLALVGGTLNLGWISRAGGLPPLTINGVSGIQNAAGALLTFNFNHTTAPSVITYVVNGKSHSMNWPYPDTMSTLRTLAAPVPLSDLVSGSNTVNIFADQTIDISNVDLILQGAGGGGSAIPAVPVPPVTVPSPPVTVPPPPVTVPPPPVAAPTPTPSPTVVPPINPGAPCGQKSGLLATGRVRSAAVHRGADQTIDIALVSHAVCTAMVDVEVFNPSGQQVFQQQFANESFTVGGEIKKFVIRLVVPNEFPTAIYTVKVGVFSTDGRTREYWNNDASRFTVT